jgi:hypothetical protein
VNSNMSSTGCIRLVLPIGDTQQASYISPASQINSRQAVTHHSGDTVPQGLHSLEATSACKHVCMQTCTMLASQHNMHLSNT